MSEVRISHPRGGKLIHINQAISVGTYYSDEIANAEELKSVQVNWKTKGALTTGKLQGTHMDSPLSGDWFDLQILSAGSNPKVDVLCKHLRVQLTQTVSQENNELTVFGSR